jgi:hypothetical protein
MYLQQCYQLSRSGESENTFDMHSDRVWAIAVGQTGGTFDDDDV